LHPDFIADVYFDRGVAYQAKGEHKKALEDFTWVRKNVSDREYIEVVEQKIRELTNKEGRKYTEAVDDLADRVIAASFLLWDRRETLREIVRDLESINWTRVALENMLFFQHLIDRYASGLYGAEIRATLMDRLYESLSRKFAATGAIRKDRLNDFYNIFIAKLNKRNAEYGSYELERVIANEFTIGRNETVLSERERMKNFSTIMLTDTAIQEAKHENFKYLEKSLLWHFANIIATLLGEPNSIKVTAYVRNLAISSLLMIHPLRGLKKIVNSFSA
jgi:hypothetical protein